METENSRNLCKVKRSSKVSPFVTLNMTTIPFLLVFGYILRYFALEKMVKKSKFLSKNEHVLNLMVTSNQRFARIFCIRNVAL